MDPNYKKRIGGRFSLTELFGIGLAGDETTHGNNVYYQATGKFSNLCSPDDEWVSLINYVFCQPASMLFTL